MPQFHIYSTTTQEVVATRLTNSSNGELDSVKHTASPGKYSYYLKNVIVYIVSAILQYAVANGTLNLLTSLAGEERGFATLAVAYVVGFVAVCSPGLIASLGCKTVIVSVNIGYLLFSVGNFSVEYYTLIPAAVFGGYSISVVWVCGTTYLNTLGVSYAEHHKTTVNKMISYTNGISMSCFSSGFVLGNALSSILLLPTRNSATRAGVNNGTAAGLCSLEPEALAENKYVYALRSTLIGMSVIGLLLVIFVLDGLKEDKAKSFSFTKLVGDMKSSLKDVGKAFCQPNIGLAAPLIVACGIGIAYFPGTFSRVYIAECVGVHIIGYVFIVYGTASAIASVCLGKVLGYVSLTTMSLLNACLNVGLVALLLIWEREPSYLVIFTVAILWGACDGSWTTLTSSYMALNLKGMLHVSHSIFTTSYIVGYSINYIFALVLTSQQLLILLAGSLLLVLPLYLVAEWLSNRRSISRCLGLPESSHSEE